MKKLQLFLFITFQAIQTHSQSLNWEWARSAKSSNMGLGEGYSVATDALENVYVAGIYTDSITFGSHVLTNNETTFLAKYDLSGNVKWAAGSCGSGIYETSIATDPFGSCYMTGYF